MRSTIDSTTKWQQRSIRKCLQNSRCIMRMCDANLVPVKLPGNGRLIISRCRTIALANRFTFAYLNMNRVTTTSKVTV